MSLKQAANGTNTSSDRTSIQAEVTALSQEITRIACRTTFGGKKVLSGFGTTESLMTATTGKINFQVGSNHDDLQTLDMNIYENDRSGTVKKGKTTIVDVNASGETQGEFVKKAKAAAEAFGKMTSATQAEKNAFAAANAAYLTITTKGGTGDDKNDVQSVAAKTGDDGWLTNAAGESKTEFTTKATALATEYGKIADDTDGIAGTTKAEKQANFIKAHSDYLDDKGAAKKAADFKGVKSNSTRAANEAGQTEIQKDGTATTDWKQTKEDVNIFKDKTSASKGFSLENLMKAVGLNAPGAGSASFQVKVDGTTGGTAYTVFDVRTSSAAQATLASIDKVINLIDTKRGDFGALENRMSSTISNQTNIMNNESDARSRIRDTDYAEEASNLSAQSIVQQAASSMLTQANSLPQMALSLLG